LSTAFRVPVRKIHHSLLFLQLQIPCGSQPVKKKDRQKEKERKSDQHYFDQLSHNFLSVGDNLQFFSLPWSFRLMVKHEDLSPAQRQLRKCKQYDMWMESSQTVALCSSTHP
jgi:hypothetical protein